MGKKLPIIIGVGLGVAAAAYAVTSSDELKARLKEFRQRATDTLADATLMIEATVISMINGGDPDENRAPEDEFEWEPELSSGRGSLL